MNTSPVSSRRIVALLCISLCLSLSLQAQDAGDPSVELEEARLRGQADGAPALGAYDLEVHEIDSEDLNRWQAVDLSDVFRDTPSIRVGGGSSAAETIYLRGLEDKLVNVSIDGATQAGYLNHHQGQIQIEPMLLRAVEVEPGAGSATQGPGALAGAIRFKTKRADDFLREGENYGAFGIGHYSSVDDGWGGTVAGFGREGPFSFLGALTYRDVDDYRDGNGKKVPYTAHEEWHLLLNGSYTFDEIHELSAQINLVRDEGDFLHRPNFTEIFPHPIASNKPVFIETTRNTYSLGYEVNPGHNDWVDFSANLYFTEFINDRDSLFDAVHSFPPPAVIDLIPNREHQYTSSYESIGLDLQNNARVELGLVHELSFGANFRFDTSSFDGSGNPADGFFELPGVGPPFLPNSYNDLPDETLDIHGVFLQDTVQLNERLKLSAGLRIDHYDYEDYQGETFTDTGLSPNLQLSYAPTEPLKLHAGYARVFRGITPHELQATGELSTPLTNANDLDPEVADKFEAGVAYDNGQIFASATVFRTRIDDVIGNNSLAGGGGTVRDNLGVLETEGYEARLGFRYEAFSAALGVSHAKPELNGDLVGDAALGLGTAYGRRWTLDLRYAFEQIDVTAGWFSEYVEELDDIQPAKESYDTHSIYLRWQAAEDLFVNFTVSNLFDEYYLDHTTTGFNGNLNRVAGLPAAGRDFRLSVAYQF